MLHDLYANIPYDFNPLSVQTLLVALGVIALGIFALIREQASPISVVFFVAAWSVSLWLFANSWMYGAIDLYLAIWWAKVSYIGIACIPAAIYHFNALVLQDYERVRKRVLALWALGLCFVVLAITTNTLFSTMYLYSWGFFPKLGITSIPFLIYFFGVILAVQLRAVAMFRRNLRYASKLARARTLVLIFSLACIAALDFVPSFGIPWYPFGYAAVFVCLIVVARSIVRYRFKAITPAFAAREIFHTMHDGLVVLDSDGLIRLVNKATCALFGEKEENLVGKRPGESMSLNIGFAEQLQSVIQRGPVRNHELELVTPGGAHRTVSVSTSDMRNTVGEILATVCMLTDITDQKKTEHEREQLIGQLQEANRQLQVIDRMKSDFVSLVSHELRTPLTTIKAFAEIMHMKPTMALPERSRLLTTINTETDRLTRLISDILDLARIESGSLTWHSEQLSIVEVIQGSITTMMPLFERKGIAVATDFAPGLSPVPGDRDRIMQVITNIFSNAVKFTPAGGSVRISARELSTPAPRIEVRITDTGIGIPARDIDRIFEKFHRSGDPLTDAFEGTGLGLAIARQIIESHGGSIWAESTQGSGSTFAFTLPLVRPEAPALRTPAAAGP